MNILRFLNDVILIAESDEKLKCTIKETNEARQEARVMIKLENIKTMSSNHELQITMENKTIENTNTNEETYLSETISSEDRNSKEINRRIALGR